MLMWEEGVLPGAAPGSEVTAREESDLEKSPSPLPEDPGELVGKGSIPW